MMWRRWENGPSSSDNNNIFIFGRNVTEAKTPMEKNCRFCHEPLRNDFYILISGIFLLLPIVIVILVWHFFPGWDGYNMKDDKNYWLRKQTKIESKFWNYFMRLNLRSIHYPLKCAYFASQKSLNSDNFGITVLFMY